MHHTSNTIRWGLLTLTLAVLSGCDPAATSNDLGKACTAASDCGGDLECTLGFCRQACPCPAGQACVDGACYERNCKGGESCFGADYCIDGKKCGDPQCAGLACGDKTCDPTTRSCVTCTSNTQCAAGFACAQGACVCAKTQGAETTCNDGQDNDCDGKVDCADEDCLDQACGGGNATCAGDKTCFCPGNQKTESTCGDGADNDCDGKVDCEDPDCNAKTCRDVAAGSSCDVAEVCTAGVCPADAFQPADTECRASAGVCDVAEKCTGTSAFCPDDGKQPRDTVCRGGAGVCDAVEVCDGASNSCPADAKLPTTTACRGSQGACDVVEFCTGGDHCPADGFQPNTTACRGSGGDAVCDPVEFCPGNGPLCPADSFKSDGQSCGTLHQDCCDLRCVNTYTDDANCGACGNVCNADETCYNGACRLPACGVTYDPATGKLSQPQICP